jgi:transposase-like protein
MAGRRRLTLDPWYRWRKQARERAALAAQTRQFLAGFARAEAFTRQLQSELAEASRCHAIAAGIIGELRLTSRHFPC